MSPDIYTVQTLAERWGCSTVTVQKMLVNGEIKGFRVGTNWRITASQVKNYEEGDTPHD